MMTKLAHWFCAREEKVYFLFFTLVTYCTHSCNMTGASEESPLPAPRSATHLPPPVSSSYIRSSPYITSPYNVRYIHHVNSTCLYLYQGLLNNEVTIPQVDKCRQKAHSIKHAKVLYVAIKNRCVIGSWWQLRRQILKPSGRWYGYKERNFCYSNFFMISCNVHAEIFKLYTISHRQS